jgi:purine-cytosine permease-like protein
VSRVARRHGIDWPPEAVGAPCCRAAASAKVEARYANKSLITPANFLILTSAFFLSVLANAISLKDYSSFFRSKETPA